MYPKYWCKHCKNKTRQEIGKVAASETFCTMIKSWKQTSFILSSSNTFRRYGSCDVPFPLFLARCYALQTLIKGKFVYLNSSPPLCLIVCLFFRFHLLRKSTFKRYDNKTQQRIKIYDTSFADTDGTWKHEWSVDYFRWKISSWKRSVSWNSGNSRLNDQLTATTFYGFSEVLNVHFTLKYS